MVDKNYITFSGGRLPVSNKDAMKKRDKTDFYATPSSLIVALYRTVEFITKESLSNKTVVDAGSGTGRWGIVHSNIHGCQGIYGIELDKERFEKLVPIDTYNRILFDNFLTMDPCIQADWIVGNPPYKHLTQWIKTGFNWLIPGGYMLLLTQSNIIATKGRNNFYNLGNFPTHIISLLERPNFYNTDEHGNESQKLATKGSYPTNYVAALFQNKHNMNCSLHNLSWARGDIILNGEKIP